VWPFLVALLLSAITVIAAGESTIVCRVTAGGAPIAGVEVVAAGKTYVTDQRGEARLQLDPGTVELTVVKEGFAPVTTTLTVAAGQPQLVTIEIEKLPTVQETVIVTSTRTGRGLENQPMRVEVLDAEEIDEKLMMTPGDVVMMLNEMGGMRVQATSPSLGAASVRVQGMRGRYTRFLSDGLPLFGEQVSLGLMQIPPLDLGRVEVIKGVASSLYGANAMGGVVNLVSRRPGDKREGQLLVNRSSRGATDAGYWDSIPLSGRWGMTLLASGNGQSRTDLDEDGWADLPKYARAVVRPRLFWDDGSGRSFFATVGGTWEDRTGGTMPGAVLPAAGGPYIEALTTRRSDAGASFQALSADGLAWNARGSWTSQHQDHEYGEVTERDDHRMGFAELTGRRMVARHTLVGGVAIERDDFQPIDVPRFAYTYIVPGVFVQDDFDPTGWLAVSASARVDWHSAFGAFVSPRISGLLRRGPWSSRLSYGTGFFAPTPLTEETESAGLTRLTVMGPLEAERGKSASFDISHANGPFSATLTLFHSAIDHPVEVERTDRYLLRNLPEPTTNAGIEAVAILKTDDFSFVANYAYVQSLEVREQGRVDVPLTPRHSVGLDGAWEWGNAGRIGVEWFYTGTQRLEANPYREESRPYSVFGVLATRRVGRVLFFVNGENLTDVRQTQWDPLVRPTRGVDGRWTVDAWAPLDGRNINGGIRVSF
jgi:outer membrane receptor for ferrienterochelin and colicins